MSNILVTTGDLHKEYTIIGPVYFQVSNKGIFSSALSTLIEYYQAELEQLKNQGQLSKNRQDWGILYGEMSAGQNDFEKAFYVAVQELKKRASLLGANAIIGMKQDIDLDTTAFQYFYLQMYGTAVKVVLTYNFCCSCGKKLDQSTVHTKCPFCDVMFDKQNIETSTECSECLSDVPGESAYCPNCGSKFE